MIPKLRKENLKAAYKVIDFLIENPGAIQVEVRKVIDKNKEVLKHGDVLGRPFKGRAHYKNYRNIEQYLIRKGLVEIKKDGKYLRYFVKK